MPELVYTGITMDFTLQDVIYLDHAAATPLDARVLDVMLPYFSEHFYNPSATYAAARQVHQAVEAARASVAHYIGARPAEITFTAGGTEANNLVIHGVMRRFPDANMLMSGIEHDSVLETGKQYDRRLVAMTEQGILDLSALESAIDDRTVLVSIMYANNEIGTIQPIRDIGRLLDTVRTGRRRRGINIPLLFHTDAAQAANYLDLHAARLGVDLLTLNGGKIYGPKQSGALYVRGGVELQTVMAGGGQEHGIRSGTENVPAIIGFAKALQIAQDTRRDESQRLSQLQHYFFKQLAAKLPGSIVNGSHKKRLPNNLHFTIPGTDNERLLFQLDATGIQAAAGSACGASSGTTSHVLQALGLSEAAARSSLRLTMGRPTTRSHLDHTLDTLDTLVSLLK